MLMCKRLKQEATVPTRVHWDDAGWDLYLCGDIAVPAHGMLMVPIGIAMKIPDGHFGKIEARSSLAKRGIETSGGVIDSGYRGEIAVLVRNTTDQEVRLEQGSRVAQMIIHKILLDSMMEVSELPESQRGTGGFGSSGK